MLFLLAVPVLILVTAAHRYLQLYAPSNWVIARARAAPPRARTMLLLAALAITMLMAMHSLADAVAAGAPGWLNLVVLVLAWDMIKFGLGGPPSRSAVHRAKPTTRDGVTTRDDEPSVGSRVSRRLPIGWSPVREVVVERRCALIDVLARRRSNPSPLRYPGGKAPLAGFFEDTIHALGLDQAHLRRAVRRRCRGRP